MTSVQFRVKDSHCIQLGEPQRKASGSPIKQIAITAFAMPGEGEAGMARLRRAIDTLTADELMP